ncbi:MAG: flippase-like domain-containing protein [Rhodothermales bacterium]|nr:flippase-like domain-containing protein [Rhodothermales bacterium]
MEDLNNNHTRDAGEAGTSRRAMIRNIVLSVCLSVATFIIVILITYEPGALRSIADSFHPFVLLLAAGTVFLRIAIGAFRLRYISHRTIRFRTAVRGQIAWDFFSSVTPSVIGGGPLAALYISKNQKIPVGIATACLLYAMFLDQLFFALTVPALFVASLYLPVFPKSIGAIGAATLATYFTAILIWVMAFGYLTLVRPDLFARLTRWVFRFKLLSRFKSKIDSALDELQGRAEIIRKEKWPFFVNGFAITILTWAARYLLIVLVIVSVFPQVDVLMVVIRNAMMTLGSLILPTPGGSGGIEGLYAIFIGSLIPKATVAPTLIAWRFLGYYMFILMGAYITLHQVQKLFDDRVSVADEDREDEFETESVNDGSASTSL